MQEATQIMLKERIVSFLPLGQRMQRKYRLIRNVMPQKVQFYEDSLDRIG